MRSIQLLLVLGLAAPAPAIASSLPGLLQEAADPAAELRAQYDAASKGRGQPGFDMEGLEAKRAGFVLRAKALMKDDPRGELAVRVRAWMATSGVEPATAEQYLDELMTKDLASPALGDVLDGLRPNMRPDARTLVETLAEKAGDRGVRGRSIRLLADHVKFDLDGLRSVEAGDISVETHAKRHGAERSKALLELSTAEVEKQYVALLERVAKDYADVKDSRGRAIGPRAEGALFEFQQLSIGKVAPEIEAEDIEGTTFKLTDYRGKVVVIDFWGHW